MRGKCWWKCSQPLRRCSEALDNCEVSDDGHRCEGRKRPDPADCHFFKYCFMDSVTGFDDVNGVECRLVETRNLWELFS